MSEYCSESIGVRMPRSSEPAWGEAGIQPRDASLILMIAIGSMGAGIKLPTFI